MPNAPTTAPVFASAARALAIGAVVSGAGLRLWQYGSNPSLWVDEAALVRNVLDRSPAELLGILDYGQVAPPGVLLGMKLATSVFGTSEYALRLVPLLAGLASLPLFLFVARAVLRPIAASVATAMFALAVPLVLFSANAKQYSSDVAATLAVLALGIGTTRTVPTRGRALALGLSPVLLLLCSQTAVFSLAAAGAVVVFATVRAPGPDRTQRFGIVALWAVAAAGTVAHGTSVMSPEGVAYAHRFWEAAYMPRDGWVAWWWTTACKPFGVSPSGEVFDGSLHYLLPACFPVLLLGGAVALGRSRPLQAAILAGPVFLAAGAAAFGVYPLAPRLGLFLVPSLILLAVAGVDGLGWWLAPVRGGQLASLLLLPLTVPAIVAAPLPRAPEHLRPVMRYAADRLRPGDAVWVYYGAGQAFFYYARRIPFAADVRVGTCDRGDPRGYLRQLDGLRGRARVWILLAHAATPAGFDERDLILDYLDAIGTRRDAFHAPPLDAGTSRAEVLLYDLSDPARLATTTADRFEVPASPPRTLWTCYGTMSPVGPVPRVLDAVMRE